MNDEGPGTPIESNPPRPRPAPLVGVQLRRAGRVLLAHTGRLSLRRGDRVVVEAEHGTDVGTVVLPSVSRAGVKPTLRILRLAEERDEARAQANDARAGEALNLAREMARSRHLPMKFFRVDLSPSSGRALFYFAADERVDFRDIVRDLATKIRGRIELRQVGARDEAKMIGGIGSCGQELCCSTFLPKFAPVSIRMAKDQGLALAPSKVSGQCGRLKCCLVYEQANYVEAARRLPKLGKRVATPDGVGRVGDLDVLRGRVRVTFEDQPPKVFEADQVTLAQAGPEVQETTRGEAERRPPHGGNQGSSHGGSGGGREPEGRRGERGPRGERESTAPARAHETPDTPRAAAPIDVSERELPEDDQPEAQPEGPNHDRDDGPGSAGSGHDDPE